METGHRRHAQVLLLACLSLICLVFASLLIAGCGEAAVEKAIEEAASQNGQDVDVDIDADGGSVSVSGENGDMTWQAGENVQIPEGFPTQLIPEGATVVSAVTSTESGALSQLVVFETSADDKEVYDHFLEALPNAGYEVTNKVRMESGDQGNAIAVQGENSTQTVVISGGGKTGEKYSFTIMVQPKSS